MDTAKTLPSDVKTNQDGKPAQAESPAKALASALTAFRKLALRLKRRAATADQQTFRAILGKREAILDSIRELVSPETATPVAELGQQEKRLVGKTLAEVATMDAESERIIRERAGKVAAEIQKLRAGRKWRETSKQWT